MSKKKILYADNDTFRCAELKSSVEGNSAFELHDCDAGQDLVEIALRMRPDIILFDTDMIDVDTAGVLEEIERVVAEQGIALVLLSSAAHYADDGESLVAGVVLKPFEMKHLGSILEEISRTFDAARNGVAAELGYSKNFRVM